MLKRDKNGFIDVIRGKGFDPSSFRTYERDVDSHPAFILRLKNSPLFFMARTNKDEYLEHDIRFIRFGPSFPKSDYYPDYPDDHWIPIDQVYKRFGDWLERHVRTYVDELDAPDLWEQLEGRSLFEDDPLIDRTDASFTKPEKERIRASLQQFKMKVLVEYAPNNDQIQAIEDRLTYLSKSLDRLNRVDWQGIALSTVISISIALSLDTERGKTLFNLFKQAFIATLEFTQ